MTALSPMREYRDWVSDSRRWNAYTPRADDIVIATYPKSGTTWMQQIVASLIFQSAEARPLSEISPWFDRRHTGPGPDPIGLLETQMHRRFIKTHTPFDGLPIYDDVRYIHVARDGRDACLSYHNHCRSFRAEYLEQLDRNGLADEAIAQPYPRAPADAAAFFRTWMRAGIAGAADGLPFHSWFAAEDTFWRSRKRSNLLLVHFADLKSDLDGEMRRVAAFLDISVNERIWRQMVKAATFPEMRRLGDQLVPRLKQSLGGAESFFNRGENGQWNGVLSENDIAEFENRCSSNLSPKLAAWLSQGRLEAGDPREVDD